MSWPCCLESDYGVPRGPYTPPQPAVPCGWCGKDAPVGFVDEDGDPCCVRCARDPHAVEMARGAMRAAVQAGRSVKAVAHAFGVSWQTVASAMRSRYATGQWLAVHGPWPSRWRPVVERARANGVPGDALRARLIAGWDVHRAVTTPVVASVARKPRARRAA